jgi:hypothetical protein
VERGDLDLLRVLLEHGATRDGDAFYHACEQSNTAFLEALYEPGFEDMVTTSSTSRTSAGCSGFSIGGSTSMPVAASTTPLAAAAA